MSLVELFDEATKSMEKQNLPALVIALLDQADKNEIIGSPDEHRFLKIISLLLGQASEPMRAKIANHVKDLSNLPSDIYLYFACDIIEIAEPFLSKDFNLPPKDLMHLINYGSTDHRLALVSRDDLTPEMTHEILRLNEVNVIRKMNENEATAVFFEYTDNFVKDGDDILVTELDDEVDTETDNPLDLALKMYSQKARYSDVIELLAGQAELPRDTVKGLFSKKEPEPISILCKGLGISNDAFAELARFRSRRLGQLERLADHVRDAYPDIDETYAQTMLTDLQSQAVNLARSMNR